MNEIAQIIKSSMGQIDRLPPDKKKEVLELLEQYEEAKLKEQARDEFLPFVKSQWAAFIHGKHHEIMADSFERVASGKLKRLIINMPPRHTKSEFASYMFPAWFLGRYPQKKIIQTAHTAELSVGFGRKVRNLIQSEDFKKIFPDVTLSACLLYTSPSPRDATLSRMPSSA